MVCENPYGFGDGLNLQKKKDQRVMTAVGGRAEPGRLDYFENQGNGTVSLPKIGMNHPRSGV